MFADRTNLVFDIYGWSRQHKRAVEICEHLVLHRNSAAEDAVSLAQFFHDEGYKWTGSKRMSYHFVVKRDGTIEQAVPLTVYTPGAAGRNRNGIHICVVGDFRTEKPAEEQLTSLKVLADVLTDALPNLKLQDHDPDKPCPGEFLSAAVVWLDVKKRRARKAEARARLHGVKF